MSCCFLYRQLSELATVCLIFSSLKIELLHEDRLDVPRVSERHATFNHTDVVKDGNRAGSDRVKCLAPKTETQT
jgi:hypothetical protein